MKLKNLIITGAACMALALPAAAADLFAGPRTLVAAPMQNLTVNAGVPNVTNSPIAVQMFDGIAKLDIFAETNTGTTGGTLQATVQSSQDLTNWTTMAGVAVVTNTTTLIYTNLMYGSILTATNSYLLPFTIPAITAATAGYAIPGQSSISFNSNAVVSANAPGFVEIGFSIQDYGRYLRLIWTSGGAITNFTCGALLTGRANYVNP